MKKYILSLISLLVIILIPCKVLAVELTDENLSSSLEGMLHYKVVNDNGELEDAGFLDSYTLNTDDKKVTLVSDGDTYIMDYTLGENPTFTYSRDITSSLTYDEYINQNDGLMWMLPYMLVAKAQGVKYEDALMYNYGMIMDLLGNSNMNFMNDSVTIIEDNEDPSNYSGNVVRKSEYGQYIVDFIKNRYTTIQTVFQDNGTDFYDTFKVEAYATNPQDHSVTINYKLTMDTTKDYSQMNGLYDKLKVDISDVDKTIDNVDKPTVVNPVASQEIPVPDTANYFPKIIIITGLLITFLGALCLIKYLNTKTIKVEE